MVASRTLLASIPLPRGDGLGWQRRCRGCLASKRAASTQVRKTPGASCHHLHDVVSVQPDGGGARVAIPDADDDEPGLWVRSQACCTTTVAGVGHSSAVSREPEHRLGLSVGRHKAPVNTSRRSALVHSRVPQEGWYAWAVQPSACVLLTTVLHRRQRDGRRRPPGPGTFPSSDGIRSVSRFGLNEMQCRRRRRRRRRRAVAASLVDLAAPGGAENPVLGVNASSACS